LVLLQTVCFKFAVQRKADHCANGHDCAKEDHFLGFGLHEGVDNVGRDEEFEAEEQIVAENVVQLLARIVDGKAAGRGEFSANEPDEAGQHAKDDHENAQNADSETGMMKITHRGYSLSRDGQAILTWVVAKQGNSCKESATNGDVKGGLQLASFDMAVTIRSARASDAGVIGGLARQFAEYLRGLGDPTEFKLNAEAYLRDGFGNRPAFSGLVAEDGGKVVGYLLYHLGCDSDAAARNLYVVDLYVEQKARRKKVGRALMTAVVEIAVAAGAEELVWSVYNRNGLAASFYEKLGAERITEIFFMKLRADALKS
jgi:ribosomal protein S18 acetylase RimI-like enzyme